MTLPQKPLAQVPFLSREDVVEQLILWRSQGFQVFADGADFSFPIADGEGKISEVNGTWQVSYTRFGVLSTLGVASSLSSLAELIRLVAGNHTNWPEQPSNVRLQADTPATNLRSISRLIGSSSICAVFDTYLDNSGLVALCQILSFGDGRVLDGVRMIATEATTRASRGRPARLSRAGVQAWAAELQISAEVRILPKESEHRRFLLLSSGHSIVLGPSLNSLDKNEAASIQDGREDQLFFDARWQSAVPLP